MVAAALLAAAPANAASLLHKIHHARNRTWHAQRLLGTCCHPYAGLAERTRSLAVREWVLGFWRAHRHHAERRVARLYYVPARVEANLLCIHPHEEPAWNTVAGGLGFVYPPGSYAQTPRRLLAVYGNSWPSWPERAQLVVGYRLVLAYGYAPWSTAGACGL